MDISIILAPIATAVIGALVGALREVRRRAKDHDARRDAEHEALCMGMCEEMRSKLYAMHERYVVHGESMPYHEKERADKVYEVTEVGIFAPKLYEKSGLPAHSVWAGKRKSASAG